MTRPAIVAATGPNEWRTTTNRMSTVATPARAWGRRMLNELSPNRRTDRPISIVPNGGLSTVMKFAASNEPKNQADQLFEAARAAAE